MQESRCLLVRAVTVSVICDIACWMVKKEAKDRGVVRYRLIVLLPLGLDLENCEGLDWRCRGYWRRVLK